MLNIKITHMSDRVTAWFELPPNIECKEQVLMDMVQEKCPDLVTMSKYDRKLTGSGFYTYFVDEGLPGYAGIFIWDSSGTIYESSKESKRLRNFIKKVVNVFGVHEVWYASEMSLDYIEEFADPYEDFDYDWKNVVKTKSAELKAMYEKQSRGEDCWWNAGDIIFLHDDFWDIID